MRSIWFPLLLLLSASTAIKFAAGEDAQRPNILWITAEDMSPTLGCYGDDFATTPAIDRLAEQGSRYTHAFATSPVCSPSRACLIHGLASTRQGTHPMRSQFPLPSSMRGFPAALREAGYYTTNNVKTDYNTSSEPQIIAASWDDNSPTAHWRGRQVGQPFFSVFNLMTSHQSRTMVWPYEQFQAEVQSQLPPAQIHNPNQVPLPPYYPDTPLVRKTVARYYDCVTVMDAQVGKLLAELERDGLDDETIVFFYSDHGSGMPRHKRALFDSGMQVPLIIRFPEKFRHWAPTAAGQSTDRLVCFEDFAPTVLSLAGMAERPTAMRGKAFLGPQAAEPHSRVFGHRDRVDEILDMARSVRSQRFLYIRNFMPHLGYNQQSAWIDQGKVREDFYALEQSGRATPAQQQYLNRSRPVEELYDCQSDPMNLTNLAADPAYQTQLSQMREELRRQMIDSLDLGLVPEIELWRVSSGSTPMQWSATGAFQPQRLLEAAWLVGSQQESEIIEAFRSDDASVRYWAAVSCQSLRSLSATVTQELVKRLDDPSLAVRIEAAAVLAKRNGDRAAVETLIELTGGDDLTVILHAARMLEWIADPHARPAVEALAERFADEPGDLAWFIRFTTSGYLSRVPAP
jgi:N-sulfoglucosamine sulfohydrolase